MDQKSDWTVSGRTIVITTHFIWVWILTGNFIRLFAWLTLTGERKNYNYNLHLRTHSTSIWSHIGWLRWRITTTLFSSFFSFVSNLWQDGKRKNHTYILNLTYTWWWEDELYLHSLPNSFYMVRRILPTLITWFILYDEKKNYTYTHYLFHSTWWEEWYLH